MGIDLNGQMDEIIKYFQLTIVGSVEQGARGSGQQSPAGQAGGRHPEPTDDHREKWGHEPKVGNPEGKRTWAVSRGFIVLSFCQIS